MQSDHIHFVKAKQTNKKPPALISRAAF